MIYARDGPVPRLEEVGMKEVEHDLLNNNCHYYYFVSLTPVERTAREVTVQPEAGN
jgi:hypothetical protein